MATGEMFLDATATGRADLVMTSTGESRIQGLEDDTNLQTTFLLFGVPFLYYFLLRCSGAAKVLVAGLLILYVVSVIITGSMGGWIGLMIIAVINFLALKGPNKWKLLFASTFLGIALFIVLGFQLEAVTIGKLLGTYDTHSRSMRQGFIQMCWEMFKDHPLIGAGPASFANEYHLYWFKANGLAPNQVNPPLNAYLQVLAENGVFGLLLFLSILGAALLELVTGLRNAVDKSEKTLGVAMLCLYACLLWTLAIFPVIDGKYMWLGLGLCVAYGNAMKRSKQPSYEELSFSTDHRPGVAEFKKQS
jgi:O-antigen ligase